MLLWLGRLIALDELDQMGLPGRVGGAAGVLVGDLVKHVVQIIHRVDHLPDIGFLIRRDWSA